MKPWCVAPKTNVTLPFRSQCIPHYFIELQRLSPIEVIGNGQRDFTAVTRAAKGIDYFFLINAHVFCRTITMSHAALAAWLCQLDRLFSRHRT